MYRCVVAGVVCAGAVPLLIQSTRTVCASGAGATHVVAVFTVLEVAHSASITCGCLSCCLRVFLSYKWCISHQL